MKTIKVAYASETGFCHGSVVVKEKPIRETKDERNARLVSEAIIKIMDLM